MPSRKYKARKVRSYTKKSGVYAAPASFTRDQAPTRSSVVKAAQLICDEAKRISATFSRTTSAATMVQTGGEQKAFVFTDGVLAPQAAVFEYGERYPGNWPSQINPATGRSSEWFKMRTNAYMSKAARRMAASAAEAYLEEETRLLSEEHGYTE